jgi:hypothetical protein
MGSGCGGIADFGGGDAPFLLEGGFWNFADTGRGGDARERGDETGFSSVWPPSSSSVSPLGSKVGLSTPRLLDPSLGASKSSDISSGLVTKFESEGGSGSADMLTTKACGR